MKHSANASSVADPCPKCGALSYTGGNCFDCGTYRPSKRTDTLDLESLDSVDFMARSFGTQMTSIEGTEEELDAYHAHQGLRRLHGPRKQGGFKSRVTVVGERQDAEASLLVQATVEPYGRTDEGQLVRALVVPWRAIVEHLNKDWTQAFKIPPRVWEELIAAAFEQDGYDEVTLTPRSGDHGRDVIAVRRGVGCIRIIDSVKAFAPHHLVGHDDVRALAGVLHTEHRASKGILSTTSDFAPGIKTDPFLSPLMPYRLELMNGAGLQSWLTRLSGK